MKIWNHLTNYFNKKSDYPLILKHWNMGNPPGIISEIFNSKWHADWMEPQEINDLDFNRIMVFAPHQDDEAIGCGGLLLKANKSIKRVVFLTKGEQAKPRLSQKELYEKRRIEGELSCKVLGAEPVFFDAPNSAEMMGDEYADRMSKLVDEFQPNLILVPWFLDKPVKHRYASILINKGLAACSLSPSVPVWQYQVHNLLPCNLVLDIGSVIERKIEAICKYESQVGEIHAYDYLIEGLNKWNSQFLPGSLRKSYAEIFFASPLSFYQSLFQEFELQSSKSYLKFSA